jgi:diguanylate cyclase (GGDEF)-like protein
MDQLVELQNQIENGRVLVVDDVPANVRLLRAHLRSVGFEVTEANSGQEALDRLQERTFDLVLLDVMMPQLDGFETCKRIKQGARTRHVPVILVTSLNDVHDKIRGQTAGADDFVTKPFDRIELLLRVKSLIRLKQMHDRILTQNQELEQAKAQLSQLANTDPLTSLANKRSLEEFLVREMERAERYRRSFSVVVIDLDNFKKVNDSRGHLTGDLVLQQAAAVLAESVRRIDMVARYGGEEFVLGLCEADLEDAAHVAEKMRARMESHVFVDGDGQPVGQLTASFGVASFPVDAVRSTDLLAVADRRLYRAKQQGRNRVVIEE